MTIYGYTRVSTVTQVREGESLDTQKLQIQSYAISKGLELDASNIFIEAGVSGGIEFASRPEGSRLTQLVISGDIIIFPKLDRAFRNTRNALKVLHDMKERKGSIHFIDLGGDVTGNGIGAIVFTILSAFATFERERIATRIREVKQVQKLQGKFTGGRRPFGFEVVGGIKVVKLEEQKVIRRMKVMRKKGKSYVYIASWIKNTMDVNFTSMGIKSILSR